MVTENVKLHGASLGCQKFGVVAILLCASFLVDPSFETLSFDPVSVEARLISYRHSQPPLHIPLSIFACCRQAKTERGMQVIIVCCG